MDIDLDPYPKQYSFRPICLQDKELFQKALKNLKEPISDNSFANIYLWRDASHLAFSEIHNHLCIFANGNNLTLFAPPIPLENASNEDITKCLKICFEIMDNYQILNCLDTSYGKIDYVSEEVLKRINNPELSTIDFSGDYIYDTQKMITLSGKAFKRKRWAKQKFMRTYPNHRVETLNNNHTSDCLSLLDLWQKHADEKKQNQITENQEYSCQTKDLRDLDIKACKQALIDYEELGLKGMVLYVDNILVGFTLGEKLGSQASILFEKTHPDYDGSAQFIFSEFCKTWKDCKEINVGDDWFIPTLRETKESYRPIRRLKKYIVTKKQPEIKIRRASIIDIERLFEIENQCFEPHIAETREELEAILSNPGITTIVAYDKDKIIGMASCFLKNKENGNIYNLVVPKEYRGKGIAKKLTDFIIKRFSLLKIQKLYLEVHESNLPAINLYKSFGFETLEILPDYYKPGNGLSMCLELSKTNKNKDESIVLTPVVR